MSHDRITLLKQLMDSSATAISADNVPSTAAQAMDHDTSILAGSLIDLRDDGDTLGSWTPTLEGFHQDFEAIGFNAEIADASALNRDVPPHEGLQVGQLALGGSSFCSLYKLLNFTYLKAIKKALPEGLRRDFIDKDIFWNRTWHFYYVWCTLSMEPILLLPENEFKDFLHDIEPWFPESDLLSYWVCLKYKDLELLLDFPDHPRFIPRYLGISSSRKDFDALILRVPSKDYCLKDEPRQPPVRPEDVKAFNDMVQGQVDLQLEQKGTSTVDMLLKSQLKSKAEVIAEKKRLKKEKQAKKRQMAADMFKRAQQYLGMRAPSMDTQDVLPKLDPFSPIPRQITEPVVLVCFDVESWERNHNIITEIGLATFSTRDLTGTHAVPGPNASNWHPLIKAHHFRIIEHNQYRNSYFVQGNPYGFSFGTSQDISIHSASLVLEELFDSLASPPHHTASTPAPAPVSAPAQSEPQTPPALILVGHALAGDIKYLAALGFAAPAHAAVRDSLDTQTLWHALNGCSAASHCAGLGGVLAALGLEYGGLHNAGNDAVFTMRVLLGMMVLEGTLRAAEA